MTEASVRLSPPPPYSSGIKAANQPAFVSACTNSSGYARSSSLRRKYSLGKSSQSSRTARRISSCESVWFTIKNLSSLSFVRNIRSGQSRHCFHRQESIEVLSPELHRLLAALDASTS